jgi:BirA family transcriptional regulator, biotin operon repressor / biotin---[acetyl-CoA-carboxylase] ligase
MRPWRRLSLLSSNAVATLGRPRIVELETVDSTNAEALRLVASGERGPLWVLAAEQTAGRGRSGRAWSSHSGNFFGSYLTVLPGSPPKAYQISLVTGVAAAEALRALVYAVPNIDIRLKWPNDILAGRAKLGGILVESTQLPGGDLAAVIGIGLNLVAHPAGELRPASDFGVLGAALPVQAVLSELNERLTHWLAIWSGGKGFADVRAAWLQLSGPPGERLMVNSGTGPVEGFYQGLDNDGALILTDAAGIHHTYSYGDVTLAG